jgi:hypothetical protein
LMPLAARKQLWLKPLSCFRIDPRFGFH